MTPILKRHKPECCMMKTQWILESGYQEACQVWLMNGWLCESVNVQECVVGGAHPVGDALTPATNICISSDKCYTLYKMSHLIHGFAQTGQCFLRGPFSRSRQPSLPTKNVIKSHIGASKRLIVKATAGANVDEKRGAGRMTYRPASYAEMVQDVVKCLIEAIKDGEFVWHHSSHHFWYTSDAQMRTCGQSVMHGFYLRS